MGNRYQGMRHYHMLDLPSPSDEVLEWLRGGDVPFSPDWRKLFADSIREVEIEEIDFNDYD